jgi:hypothetical protein
LYSYSKWIYQIYRDNDSGIQYHILQLTNQTRVGSKQDLPL